MTSIRIENVTIGGKPTTFVIFPAKDKKYTLHLYQGSTPWEMMDNEVLIEDIGDSWTQNALINNRNLSVNEWSIIRKALDLLKNISNA